MIHEERISAEFSFDAAAIPDWKVVNLQLVHESADVEGLRNPPGSQGTSVPGTPRTSPLDAS